MSVDSDTLAAARKNLRLHKKPFNVIKLFITSLIINAQALIKNVLTSTLFLFTFVPATALYLFLKKENMFTNQIFLLESIFWYVVWWVGLGILSSVGFGSGMHSGILFLFPHIFKVVSASRNCPSMEFNGFCDVWWQDCPMSCQAASSTRKEEVEMTKIILQCLVPAVLWGFGTAIGEVPPYLIARAAATSGEGSDELEEETKGDDVLSRMKGMMVDYVSRYGFWGVLVMSAWPNAAFDLVGICCGQLGVSFMTFFVATVIGKAFIKVFGQVLFFTYWFVNPELFIGGIVHLFEQVKQVLTFIPLTGEQIRDQMFNALKKVSVGVEEEEEEEGLVKRIGNGVIFAIILYFIVSCIEHIAQSRQKTLDEKTLTSQKKQK
eukprot:maker-scaffold_1-snap-gene-26.56-mRNA-1 protein AED:0.27 eAED:0.27 QI:150/1/1/1/1/1/2/82/377